MCRVPVKLRELVKQRLAAAAEEIFELLERTIAEYEEETERQRRLLGPLSPACSPSSVGAPACSPSSVGAPACSPSSVGAPACSPSSVGAPACSLSSVGASDLEPNLKEEPQEESIQVPLRWESQVTAPPSGLTFPVNDEDGEPQMELRILETYSEQAKRSEGPARSSEGPARSSEGPAWSTNPSVSSELPFSCPVCDKSFKWQRQLERHMSSHMCPVSEDELLSLDQTKVAAAVTDSPSPFSCSVCGTRLANRRSLRRHMLLHTNEKALRKTPSREERKPFSCFLCERGFETESELERHVPLHTHHQTEVGVRYKNKGYACTDCGKVFFYPTCLKKHTRTHEQQQKLNEDKLLLSLESNQEQSDVEDQQEFEFEFEYHVSNQDVPETEGVLGSDTKGQQLCCVCGDMFENETLMKKHMEIHSGETEQASENREALNSEGAAGVQTVEKPSAPGGSTQNETETHNLHRTEDECGSKREEYLCPFCDKVCYSHIGFKKHKTLHKDDYKCPFCKLRFKKYRYRQHHIVTAHTPQQEAKAREKSFHCDLCPLSFWKSRTLRHHRSMHKKKPKKPSLAPKTFKCPHCPRVFCYEKSLTSHVKLHLDDRRYDDKPLSCAVCGMGFYKERLLARHMTSHSVARSSEEEHCCDECGETFETKSHLEEHMWTHTPPEPGEQQESSPGYVIQEAEEALKSEGAAEFLCPHCNTLFSSLSGLRKHKFSHKDDLTCPFCELRFKRRRKRELHILSKHISPEKDDGGLNVVAAERLYYCKRCPKSFWDKKDFFHHRAVHQNKAAPDKTPNVFTCSFCSKVFCHEKSWTNHLKVHVKDQRVDRPFSCSVCGVGFDKEKQLALHLEGHSGARNSKEECAGGKKESLLLKHMKTSFSCSVSLERFEVRSSSEQLTSSHTPLDPEESLENVFVDPTEEMELSEIVECVTTSDRDQVQEEMWHKQSENSKSML